MKEIDDVVVVLDVDRHVQAERMPDRSQGGRIDLLTEVEESRIARKHPYDEKDYRYQKEHGGNCEKGSRDDVTL